MADQKKNAVRAGNGAGEPAIDQAFLKRSRQDTGLHEDSSDLHDEVKRRKTNAPVRKSGVVLIGSTVTPPRQNGKSNPKPSPLDGVPEQTQAGSNNRNGAGRDEITHIQISTKSTTQGPPREATQGAAGGGTPPVANKRATGKQELRVFACVWRLSQFYTLTYCLQIEQGS